MPPLFRVQCNTTTIMFNSFLHISQQPKGKWQKKYVVVQVDVSTLWDILWPTIPGELPYHKK